MDRIEAMIFDYGSTNRTDIRPIDPRDLSKIVYTPKPPSAIITGGKVQKTVKDVNGTIAKKNLSNVVEQVRPQQRRVVMPPAVDVDIIADPGVRRILVEDMYTSCTRRAYAGEPIPPSVRAPLSTRYARADILAVSKRTTPYVSPEWRIESMKWEKKQQRSYCDRNKVFWGKS